MTASKDFFKKFTGDIWIETGTYMGYGVTQAIDAGFKQIVSIELSERFFNDAKQKFINFPQVNIHHGRAHDVLPSILKNLQNEKIVFWLDAHYSQCETAGEDDPNPLLKELQAIKMWKNFNNGKTPTILIDDMRTFTYGNSGFSEKEIIASLLEIDEKYEIHREDGQNEMFPSDVLVAIIS